MKAALFMQWFLTRCNRADFSCSGISLWTIPRPLGSKQLTKKNIIRAAITETPCTQSHAARDFYYWPIYLQLCSTSDSSHPRTGCALREDSCRTSIIRNDYSDGRHLDLILIQWWGKADIPQHLWCDDWASCQLACRRGGSYSTAPSLDLLWATFLVFWLKEEDVKKKIKDASKKAYPRFKRSYFSHLKQDYSLRLNDVKV